jgi:hypothetical protein
MTDEKIYTSESPALTGALVGSMMNKGDNDFATLAAMNGGMGGAWNNPFIYLVWMMFAQRYMGGQGGDTNLQSQISALQGVVQDNHNSDLLMQAVNGSTEAVQNLAVAMNANFDQVSAAICGVRNGITEANGNIQLAAERMIANNNMQSGILGSKVDNAACGIKTAILEQGYQNQLNNCQQTNTILLQSQGLQNVVQNGFTQIGFQIERNACDVKETSIANTQKIIDTLNNHWQLESQTTIQQLRDEVGRLNQTQALIAALKPATTTTT